MGLEARSWARQLSVQLPLCLLGYGCPECACSTVVANLDISSKAEPTIFFLDKSLKCCLLVIVVVELAPAAEMSDSQMQIRWILPEKRCKASLRFWGLVRRMKA